MLFLATPAQAATFYVNSFSDQSDASLTDGVCATPGGVCTLRAATEQAHDAWSPGHDNVVLQGGSYAVSAGQLSIFNDVTIEGAGAFATSIVGSGSARVAFANTAAGTLTELRDLAVTAGRESDASGGGLWLEGPGSYALKRIALYDNQASSTIGSARGGAIVKRGTGSLTIRRTLISGNRVTTTGPGSDYATGGAIYHQSGSLTVENTTFSHNEAHGVSGRTLKAVGSISTPARRCATSPSPTARSWRPRARLPVPTSP